MLPGADPLPPYQTLDEAASTVFGGVPSDVVERARQLVVKSPGGPGALRRSLHRQGDTGLTIVSGVRSAIGLFFGSKQGRAEAVASSSAPMQR